MVSYPRLGLPSGLFPSRFSTKTLFSIRLIFLHFIIFDFITSMLSDEYKSWCFSYTIFSSLFLIPLWAQISSLGLHSWMFSDFALPLSWKTQVAQSNCYNQWQIQLEMKRQANLSVEGKCPVPQTQKESTQLHYTVRSENGVKCIHL
jgi:hypothetical protein